MYHVSIDGFLQGLDDMGGKASNKQLLEKLEWAKEDYAFARKILVSNGDVKLGRGRGGTVSRVLPPPVA